MLHNTSMDKKTILIEHMEPTINRWIIEEYKEALSIASKSSLNLIITGVTDPIIQAVLQAHSIPHTRLHSWEICDMPGAIVLDLWADKNLYSWEAASASCFIVGGIMGDHPPRGRGMLLRFMFDWASARRLGPLQFSVDGTVKIISTILNGYELSQIKIVESARLNVKTPLGSLEVVLPFAYPMDDKGNPQVAKGIIRLLSKGIMWDEEE